MLVGDKLKLTRNDKLCCVPPLFHCFGLVCGLLATIVHGSKVVFPSEVFNPIAILKSLEAEQCTVIHAVPTMFDTLVGHRRKQIKSNKAEQLSLRTGLIAGSTLSPSKLADIRDILGIPNLLYPFGNALILLYSVYSLTFLVGMTELSAVSFCTDCSHSLIEDCSFVGAVMPHTMAKVIDENGNVTTLNEPGELCVSGYLTHLGYYQNPEKSREILHTDELGRSWIHTGDLVTIDQNGNCRVVGRLKDMIKKD